MREESAMNKRLRMTAGRRGGNALVVLACLAACYAPLRGGEVPLTVVERAGVKLDLPQLERQLPGITSRMQWVQMPLLEISSTGLRARVRAGRPISYLVPPAVEAYIQEHELYR